MTQIIGFCGEKQSGKDSACNLIIMLKLVENGVCKRARLNDHGDIEVSDIFGETVSPDLDWFSLTHPNVSATLLFNDQVHFCRKYSFADKLKQICVDVMGLTNAQVNGSNTDKNTHTHLKWQNMPAKSSFNNPKKKGSMTAREFLQYFGTDICRHMYENVWVDTVLRRIDAEKPELALISDVRFPNEVKCIQDRGGFVIGLSRSPFQTTQRHSSEQVPLDLCNAVIDNSQLSIPDTNEQIYNVVKQFTNVIPQGL